MLVGFYTLYEKSTVCDMECSWYGIREKHVMWYGMLVV